VTSRQKQWLDQVGSVLESLNQGVIISDEDRRTIFANSMFLEMGKMSAEDILGRSVMDLYLQMKLAGCRNLLRAVGPRGGLNMNSTFRNPTAGVCPLRLRPASCMAPMDALTELLRRRTSATRNGFKRN
jgi:PAS domain-containing protein